MPRKRKKKLTYTEVYLVKNEAEASEKRLELWNKGYKFNEIFTCTRWDKFGDYYKEVSARRFGYEN